MGFLGQIFELSDIARIFILSFLELILSADNALVIALLIRHLTPHLQKKALFIGIFSAFLLRILAVTFASYLIRFSWIEVVGALYLLFLCIHFFIVKKKKEDALVKTFSLWKTIVLVELLDLAFALDSIISGLAFIAPFNISGGVNPKLWILYVGGIIGIIGVRFAAELFSRFLKVFPKILPSAYLLIGWIGLQLFFDGLFKIIGINLRDILWTTFLFWTGVAIFLALGFVKRTSSDDSI